MVCEEHSKMQSCYLLKKTEVEIQRFLEKPFHFISWQISKRSPPECFNKVFWRKEIPL